MPDGFADRVLRAGPGVAREGRQAQARHADRDRRRRHAHRGRRTDHLDRRPADGSRPAQFQDFGLSLRIPDKAEGTKLTFKALQTYSGGEVVRWIGAAGSDNPAPQVTLTAAADDAAAHGDPAKPTAAAGTSVSVDDDDGAGNGLAVVALIVGALGLLAGVAGLLTARRAQAAS